MRRNSSGLCALPPTGPTAQIVGVPTPAVKPEIGAAAGELAVGLEAGLGGGLHVDLEQPLRRRRLHQRQELAADRQFRLRPRHVAALDDRADARHRIVAIRRLHVAQVDLALRPGRHRVDALPAAHQADVHRDAAIEVGQRVQRLHLARKLLDRADPLGEVAAGMRRLAGDAECR